MVGYSLVLAILLGVAWADDVGQCKCYCGLNPAQEPTFVGQFTDNFCTGCTPAACVAHYHGTCDTAQTSGVIKETCSVKYFWHTGALGKCQKNCNATRDVNCVTGDGTVVDIATCDPIKSKKPLAQQYCLGDECDTNNKCQCFCSTVGDPVFVGLFDDAGCDKCDQAACNLHFPSSCPAEGKPGKASQKCKSGGSIGPGGIAALVIFLLLLVGGAGAAIGFFVWRAQQKKKQQQQQQQQQQPTTTTGNETTPLVTPQQQA